MTRLVIVGAGYTGKYLARQAIEKGWEVIGTTRSAETAAELQDMGATPLMLDASEDGIEGLDATLISGAKVVYSVPTLFRSVPPGDAHLDYPRLVLEACENAGAAQFIYLSSTSVYGDHGGSEVDEDSERRPDTPFGIMRRDIEDLTMEWDGDVETQVVRIAGIYGPGRALPDYVASGRYTLVNPDKETNRIHQKDLVAIIMAVLEQEPASGGAYVAADGNPVRVGDLIDYLVERGMEKPRETTLQAYEEKRGPNAAARWLTKTRCNSARTRQELGIEFEYPDVFAFYRDFY